MHGVLTAPLAMLLKLQSSLKRFLILVRIIIRALAFGTFEFDEIVLGHGDLINQ